MDKYHVSIGSFVEQIKGQLRNPNDMLESIGTWSGIDRPYVYTIHCKEEKGEGYDINISLEEVK